MLLAKNVPPACRLLPPDKVFEAMRADTDGRISFWSGVSVMSMNSLLVCGNAKGQLAAWVVPASQKVPAPTIKTATITATYSVGFCGHAEVATTTFETSSCEKTVQGVATELTTVSSCHSQSNLSTSHPSVEQEEVDLAPWACKLGWTILLL